ncbi:MAG: rod shape-determining protein MreC [Desulfobulbaceae bacterium]
MRKKGSGKRNGGGRSLKIVLLSGVLLPLVLIFLVSTLGSQKFGTLHRLIAEAAGPVQLVAGRMVDYFNTFRKDYLDRFSAHDENKRLWKELQECREAANRNREALATNTRLRKLLEFKEAMAQPTVAARIVGKDPSLWFRSVVIDRGSSDGVAKGMPVVSGDGVVGQVFTVSPNFSKVLLAISPSSAIDVLLQKSRVRGILKGTGSLTCSLEYVLKTVDVQEGDQVVTAGYGGLFPPGVPVGVVSKVVKQRRGMFLELEVTPSVDFLTLEDLLVIQQEAPFAEQ